MEYIHSGVLRPLVKELREAGVVKCPHAKLQAYTAYHPDADGMRRALSPLPFTCPVQSDAGSGEEFRRKGYAITSALDHVRVDKPHGTGKDIGAGPYINTGYPKRGPLDHVIRVRVAHRDI